MNCLPLPYSMATTCSLKHRYLFLELKKAYWGELRGHYLIKHFLIQLKVPFTPNILMQCIESFSRNNKNHLKSKKAAIWSSGKVEIEIQAGVQEALNIMIYREECVLGKQIDLSLNPAFATW